MKNHFTLVLLSFSLYLASCNDKYNSTKNQPIVEVNGHTLYADELESVIPENTNPKDSTELAQSFIKKWVTNNLIYDKAQNNIGNNPEIEELIEEYRKSLIIHQYQQKLISQKLPKEPSEEALKEFYEKYKSQFQLKENIIQGILLIVPNSAQNLANVRTWVQSSNEASLDKIEKYRIQNAISYDYFIDQWMPFIDILKKTPLQISDPSAFVRNNRFIETKDSTKSYFLKISAFKCVNDIEPFETAKPKIINLMMNKLKTEFIQKFENDIYQDALEDKDIRFYRKSN